MIRRAVFGAVALQILAAPAQADDDITPLLVARKAAVIAAYNSGDIDTLAEHYTEDAWHISPRRPPAQGRQAIAAYFAPAMAFYTMESTADVLNVLVDGDTAVMISSNELKGSPRPGATRDGKPAPSFTERRLNMTVFERQPDGRWLISRFIDTTPPEPAAN